VSNDAPHREAKPIPVDQGIARHQARCAVFQVGHWVRLASVLALISLASGCRGCAPAPGTEGVRNVPGRLVEATPMAARAAAVCAVVVAPSVSEGSAPLAVQFAAEGTCTETEGAFTWDFGDGSPPVQARNTLHVYEAPGRYTVRVTLVDAGHTARDADETVITVSAN